MPLDFTPSDRLAAAPASLPWTAERFMAALHPVDARGCVSMMLADSGDMHTRTYRPGELEGVVGPFIEGESYVAMNRSYGPRGRSKLATLNALWLDLDTYRIPRLATLPRDEVAAILRNAIADAGLPQPSFLIHSGRGWYAIWLIRGLATPGLRRWSAVMRALVRWARPLGADPACVDAARVLRLPESWHAGANRQVTVVDATAKRVDFDLFAEAVWRTTGRPTRRDYDERKRFKAARAVRQTSAKSSDRPRGLTRRAFWRLALGDLERLLDHWGGVIPVGYRDLWLHLWLTALSWNAVETDLAECVVAKAAIVAPDMSAREVRRMMAATVQRADRAATGQRTVDGRDPRYDYGGGRMADMLGVDRGMAEAIGLRQLVTDELRADRLRRGRTARRRAAGALPRAIWLAAHPISRERPWEAEGISRATWYRRLRRIRDRRRGAQIAGLLAGSSGLGPFVETGSALLYEGVALPSADTRRPGARLEASGTQTAPLNPLPTLNSTTQPNQTPKSELRTTAISEHRPTDPSPAQAPDGPARPEPIRMALVDPEILALAAGRLPPVDIGNLTRSAVALGAGPVDRLDLGRRLGLDYDQLERLDPWLRLDGRMVLGLCAPPTEPAKTRRKSRQGSLFDEREFVPATSIGGKSSIKKAVIDAGVAAMARSGVREKQARTFLGRLFRDHGLGGVTEAVDALARQDVVAEPCAWLQAALRNKSARQVGVGASSSRFASPTAKSNTAPRPLATPEYLGVSPARAALIRERNSDLQLKIRSSSE